MLYILYHISSNMVLGVAALTTNDLPLALSCLAVLDPCISHLLPYNVYMCISLHGMIKQSQVYTCMYISCSLVHICRYMYRHVTYTCMYMYMHTHIRARDMCLHLKGICLEGKEFFTPATCTQDAF